MTDRRKFLQLTGTAALTALTSPFSMAGQRTLPMRTIPGTDERLAVVGLGNSNAFRQGDFALSRQLLESFFGQGGRYVDCGGDGDAVFAL